MFSIIIDTRNSERALVPTLATLVSGAAAGNVRDVIIADGGSTDATLEVADLAGCEVLVDEAPLGQRLRDAAAKARSPWLMFLKPGIVIDTTWTDESARFVQQMEARAPDEARAAVFRKAPAAGAERPMLLEAFGLIRAAFGGRPHPEQGLIIPRQFYDRLGGHRDVADPEADLIARIGRRRITILRSGALVIGGRYA